MPTKQNRRVKDTGSEPGFSLIQLITVVAIMAILATILIPIVSNALERGRSSLCESNLRQMGAAALLFAQENGGALPDNRYGGYYFDRQIINYLEMDPADPKRITVCPSCEPMDVWFSTVYGTSYGVNAYATGVSDAEGAQLSGYDAIYNFQDPARVGLYMDAYYMVREINYHTGSGRDGNASLRARHGGNRINVVFLDGHVESIIPIEGEEGFYQQIMPRQAGSP